MNRKKLKTYSHIHIVKKQMISLHVHSAKSYPTQTQSAKLFLVSEYANDNSKHGSWKLNLVYTFSYIKDIVNVF